MKKSLQLTNMSDIWIKLNSINYLQLLSYFSAISQIAIIVEISQLNNWLMQWVKTIFSRKSQMEMNLMRFIVSPICHCQKYLVFMRLLRKNYLSLWLISFHPNTSACNWIQGVYLNWWILLRLYQELYLLAYQVILRWFQL